MNLKIQHRNFRLQEGLTELIEKKSQKVRKMLPSFASQDLALHVTLEKLSRGKQYRAALVLTLPQNAIRAEDIEASPSQSMLRAFDELLRRIGKFKSQLNRERFWQRQRLSVLPGPVTNEKEEIARSINQSLDRLENYIRRELYREVLVENLPPGLIEPQAILDEVFVEASSSSGSKPDNWTVEQWLFQIARDKLQKRVEEVEACRDQPHVEEAAESLERWYDEPLNFYQPDEVLKVGDLLPDSSSTPEELLAQHEQEEQLQKAIAHLPESIRESFVLFALEGFSSDEIAMITSRSPEKVLEEVLEAQDLLRREVPIR